MLPGLCIECSLTSLSIQDFWAVLETLCMSSMHDSVFWFVSAGYVLCRASESMVTSKGKIILLVQSQILILCCHLYLLQELWECFFIEPFFSVLTVNLRRKSLHFIWVNSHLQDFTDIFTDTHISWLAKVDLSGPKQTGRNFALQKRYCLKFCLNGRRTSVCQK